MLAPRRNRTEILLTIIRSPPAIYAGCRRIEVERVKIGDRRSARIMPDDVKNSRMEKKRTRENGFAHGEKEEREKEREEM